MRYQGIGDLLSSAQRALTPPEPAFPAPAHHQGGRVIGTVGVCGGMVGEHRHAKLLLLVKDIHPVEDDIVLDLIPLLEIGVRIAAAADVKGGVLVDGLIAKRHGKERLKFPAAIVMGAAPLRAPVFGFDVPWIADPCVLVVGEARAEVDTSLPLGERNGGLETAAQNLTGYEGAQTNG